MTHNTVYYINAKWSTLMKKCTVWLLLAVLLLTLAPCALAQEAEVSPIPITTVEELQSIDPAGSYILMNDLDLAGVEWTPLTLSGSFDGNGHAILNLSLGKLTEQYGLSFDGNRKEYDTRFCGMFGFVSGSIRNLRLLGVEGLAESSEPCFMGGLVGCLQGGTISGCSVSGTLELRAFDRCFGVGGLVGHGLGRVENCSVDVTLICVDTDPSADEQFLGGIYAAGYIDVTGCNVNIDGYVSEHGYTHNGGIAGLCVRYPLSDKHPAAITDNRVIGKITFFEDVASRRAYCKAIVGETLSNYLKTSGNTHDFVRDERYDYETELRPEICESPVYLEETTTGHCTEYGFTRYTCEGCGYSWRGNYTLPQHTPGEWLITTAPTPESEGLAQSVCADCSLPLQQVIPIVEMPDLPVSDSTAPAETPDGAQERPEESRRDWYLIAGLEACAVLGLVAVLARRYKKK